jgi:hypothetical protein
MPHSIEDLVMDEVKQMPGVNVSEPNMDLPLISINICNMGVFFLIQHLEQIFQTDIDGRELNHHSTINEIIKAVMDSFGT